MKILSFDPGKTNFAWSLIKDEKCYHHGFVSTTTDISFDHLYDQLGKFMREVEVLFEKHKPDFIAIERMQHRPKFGGGAVVEYINIMIGSLLTLARQRCIKTMTFPAVTWKSHMKRVFGWKTDKQRPFTMATQKMSVPAPKGMTRKLKGKTVPVKKTTKEITGALADQPRANSDLTSHEADAIGIGCYCWNRITRIDIVKSVLT